MIASSFLSCSTQNLGHEAEEQKVLVFSRTKGWKHSSIPFAIDAIQKLGVENNFIVDTTTNSKSFTDENLKNYSAVIFNLTTGNVLNADQQAAFERYIQAGGGYVGIHSAADTEYEWPWYGKLMGAHFASHPHNPNVRTASIDVVDSTHTASSMLPKRWERTDEWYNYRSFYANINILATLDENTYGGGSNGAFHPISWYHEFDGGRSFYTGGGHTDESFSEPLFLDHLLGGIKYAMGSGIPLDYSKSYAVVTPEENRFVKTVLVNDLNTPMTLDISDDGKIFYTELRSANLSMYNTKTGENKLIHRFDVATKGGTGLIGVTLDPNFLENNWIYLYYAPPTDVEPIIFNLSRFTLKNGNTLDLASEKILLQVPVQENSGAHHGGSLAWDKDGNLYLSTGDSSSPFPANGFAPIDERPGKEFFSLDAQRSSSNTNDLKGKILKIHPQKDGTYTIPEGNLFPKGMEKTLPEIFVMGLRNPYRIAVNPVTSVLYWGEIGPDAGKDSIQGPKGYDEFNQAKKAGNYGWPYFIADNKAYSHWDFASDTAGPLFNPDAPENNSPNNTGLNRIPPAVPAMIYYPYESSKKFPELGQGGRSAMAGEFYLFDEKISSSNKFPDYYDKTLFVFDWMRNWVMALRFDENENFVRAEPFMSTNGDFRRPIDLTFGRDGIMYMLEYGSVYGADNDDARLVKIEYNTGNRKSVAKAGIIDSAATAHRDKVSQLTSERAVPFKREAVGQAPLRVLFSSRGTKDLDDDDNIIYQWFFDGNKVNSTETNPTHVYKENGIYQAILKVIDKEGLSSSDTLFVKVGNERPSVSINTPDNKSFFWPGEPFNYSIKVNDKEDGKFNAKNIKVYFNYNPEPPAPSTDRVNEQNLTSGFENGSNGATLISNSDCKACHTLDKVSVGPSYTAVAEKYKNQEGALDKLAKKIIDGGGGNWGTTYVMSAHPQITFEDSRQMVSYILSLAEPAKSKTTLSQKGIINFNEHKEEHLNGQYILFASYTDKGSNGIGPLTGSELMTLRNSRVATAFADAHTGFPRWGNSLGEGDHKAFILLKNIDLKGVKQFTYEYASLNKDGIIEVRINSQEGPVISTVAYKATGGWEKMGKVTGKINDPIEGRNDLYFMVLNPQKPNDNIIKLSHITFEN